MDLQDYDDAVHRFHPLVPCQALGQALVLSHQGRGDSVGCFVLLSAQPLPLWIADQVRNDVCGASMRVSPPCGYCLKASMTAARSVCSVDAGPGPV